MSASKSARPVRKSAEMGSDPLHALDTPLPGVVEAIELYEAAMRHYAPAALFTSRVARSSATSAALTAEFSE